MAASPCASKADILKADDAILDAAFTAHTVRHGCSEQGGCDARRVLDDARDRLRTLLAAESVQAARADGRPSLEHVIHTPLAGVSRSGLPDPG